MSEVVEFRASAPLVAEISAEAARRGVSPDVWLREPVARALAPDAGFYGVLSNGTWSAVDGADVEVHGGSLVFLGRHGRPDKMIAAGGWDQVRRMSEDMRECVPAREFAPA